MSRLRRECVEQPPQLLDVREFGELHEVGLARDHVFRLARPSPSPTICWATLIASRISWFNVSLVCAQLANDVGRGLRQFLAGELLVQEVRRASHSSAE